MNIILTGASRGIGYEVCKILTSQGHKVIAISRSKEKLNKLQAECTTGQLIPLPMDIQSKNFEIDLITGISKHTDQVDILINNAGSLVNKEFMALTDDDFDGIFDVNVKGPFRLIRALLPFFTQNAHIVNIGSMGGYQGSVKFPGLSLYSASKGALAILTECLAEELKNTGIRVNCLALGAAQTEMLEEAFPGYIAPLNAREMAAFISDFALNGTQFFNGKIIPVSLSTP